MKSNFYIMYISTFSGRFIFENQSMQAKISHKIPVYRDVVGYNNAKNSNINPKRVEGGWVNLPTPIFEKKSIKKGLENQLTIEFDYKWQLFSNLDFFTKND